MTELKWYALQVYSGQEKKAARQLKDNIEQNPNLQEFFGDVLVPSEEVVEMRNGKKRLVERKFFPGYILINMLIGQETWNLVRRTPNVFGFVGGQDNEPVPLTEEEITRLLNRIEGKRTKDVHDSPFQVGETVRVINGPFSDFSAVIEEVMQERESVKVLVAVFGRSTPLELNFSQIMKE